MSNQLDFLSSEALKPLQVVKKDFLSKNTEHLDFRIDQIQEDDVLMGGEHHRLHRIFVSGADYPDYKYTGWLLSDDVDNCLMCNSAFGWFRRKYFCWACGNIYCKKCLAPEKVVVYEIDTAGKKDVCAQCYYGQDPLYAMQNSNKAKAAKGKKQKKGHDDDGYGDGSEYYKPELSPEEQFRLDAIKRLVEQGPKPKSLSSSQLSSTMPTNEYDALIQSFEPRILSKNEEGEVVANQNRDFVLVKPNPSFVMKTWKSDDRLKLFINVTSNKLIPFKSTMKNGKDDKRQIVAIVGEMRMATDDRGQQYIIIDVITSPDEINICDLDFSGKDRAETCVKVLQLVRDLHDIEIEAAYKILRIANNYKSEKDDEVIETYVPRTETFYRDDDNEAGAKAVLAFYAKIKKETEGGRKGDPDGIRALKPGPKRRCVNFTIQPNPGFVMVANIEDGRKAYINVCHHECIPQFGPDGPFVILGRERVFVDKDTNSICPIYMIMISSVSYAVLNPKIGAVMPIPQRMSSYIINLINDEVKDQLSSETIQFPVYPRGFVGPNKNTTMLDIEQISIPSEVLIQKEVNTNRLSGSNGMKMKSEGNGFEFETGSILSFSTADSTPTVGFTCSVLPVKDIIDSIEIVSLSSAVSIDLNLLLLKPDTGFVIEASNKSGQMFYVNVCHHPEVGEVNKVSQNWLAQLDSLESPVGDEYLSTVFLMGSMGVIVNAEGNGAQPKRALTLDVVVPRSEYVRTLEDETEAMRDDLAINVLEFITRIGVNLSTSYHVPLTDGGYKKPSFYLGTSFPKLASDAVDSDVVNKAFLSDSGGRQSEAYSEIDGQVLAAATYLKEPFPPLVVNIKSDDEYQAQKVAVITAKLWRFSPKTNSWKLRKVQLRGRRLQFYKKDQFKGEFDVKECTIGIPNLSTMDSNSPTKFLFTLTSALSKDLVITLATPSEDDRMDWVRLISTYSRLMAATAACLKRPETRRGHLRKQSKIMKKWIVRYFILDMGILRIFERESHENGKVGEGVNLKGRFPMAGAVVRVRGSTRIFLSNVGFKDLLLEATNVDDCDSWYSDMLKHVQYAEENLVVEGINDDDD